MVSIQRRNLTVIPLVNSCSAEGVQVIARLGVLLVDPPRGVFSVDTVLESATSGRVRVSALPDTSEVILVTFS